MAELNSQIPFFLNSFLSKPATALPKGSLWVLSFDGSYLAPGEQSIATNSVVPVTAILRGTQFEPGEWDIQRGLGTLLARDYQQTKGCLFAQAVSIPGESSQANPEGIQTNGFIRTFSGGGRNSFLPLQISFLETNVSFVENVIRPWVIATSHLGLLARSGRDNYRCNITIYKLGVFSINQSPYVACKYTFFGACPVEVSGEDYSYVATSSPIIKTASFIYHYYTITTSQNNPAITQNSSLIPVPLATRRQNVSVNVAQAQSVTP